MTGRRFPTARKIVMALGDAGIIYFSFRLLILSGQSAEIVWPTVESDTGLLLLIMLLTILLLKVNGLYYVAKKSFAEVTLGILGSNLWVLFLVVSLSFFLPLGDNSRRLIVLCLGMQTVLIAGWRYVVWRVERSIRKTRSLLLVGSEEECSHVYQRLSRQPQLNMKLKYVCTDLEKAPWEEAAKEVDVICVCPDMRHRHKVKIINYCHAQGKEALLIPNTYEIFLNRAGLRRIDDIPVLRAPSLLPSLEVRVLKRLLDIFVASLGFLCALPFMLATAIAIKLTDPGPLLYSQIRTGKKGKEFRVYKFRTMKVDAEKYTGPMLAQENDPRITKTGKFLRMVRLDELPQIWNVLVGDMSIVGPRPERPFFVEKFTAEIPEYAYRHNVKPGITGLAQVYGKYNTTAFDKLVYDLMYIQQCGLLTDLAIIVRTVKVLLTKSATEGAGADNQEINLSRFAVGGEVYGDF